jgi:hypothetical protein
VHAGGEVRVVDDHLHDVPNPVYDLLEIVGERVPHPVDIVLERDGAFPPIDALLAELDRARAALARGRTRLGATSGDPAMWAASSATAAERAFGGELGLLCGTGWGDTPSVRLQEGSDSVRLERLLARVYTDDRARTRFLAAPVREAIEAGLSPEAARAIRHVDETGLKLAAASFARKRRANGI